MKKNTNSNMPEENGIYAGTSERIIDDVQRFAAGRFRNKSNTGIQTCGGGQVVYRRIYERTFRLCA